MNPMLNKALVTTTLSVLLGGSALAQAPTLQANPAANNGQSINGVGLFFDVESLVGTRITHLTTASSTSLGATFRIEVLTRPGSVLGNPGPGQSLSGWTSLGVATGRQNSTDGSLPSEVIDIPDIEVPCNGVVGVAVVFVDTSVQYFGTGPAPLQTFTDGVLTLTTGDARSIPFSTGSPWLSSRGLVGELIYEEVREPGRLFMRKTFGGFTDISTTGTPLSLGDDEERDIFTAVGNSVFGSGNVRIGSNGGVRFPGATVGADLFPGNRPLPSISAFNGAVALLPFWDDIDTQSGSVGQIYWQQDCCELIIQWDDVGFYNGAPSERATFQLTVYANEDVLAQFAYRDVEGARAGGGESATIGFQAGGLSETFQYSFDARSAVDNFTNIEIVQSPALIFDNTLPGAYVDISSTGTPLNLADDESIDIVTTIGNELLNAGVVRVGSNGGLRFAGSSPDLGPGNQQIPSLMAFGAEQALLPFWDDINTDSGQGGQIYWEEIGTSLIVQWDRVEFFGSGSTQTATFQVQVHAAGPTYAQFLYEDVSGARAANGGSATVGYQDPSTGGGSTVSFDSPIIQDGSVWSLTTRQPDVGTSYCGPANVNSTFGSAQITASGSRSAACDTLVLTASVLPANTFGFFLVSRDTGFAASPGGSQGNLCLSGSIGRSVGLGILNSGPSGTISTPALLSALPTPTGAVSALPGDTWNFQAWFRDNLNGTTTSNFTDAVQVKVGL